MKVRLKSGEIADLKTGQAMRLLQSGEATEWSDLPKKAKADDKPVPKPKSTGSKADGSADVPVG